MTVYEDPVLTVTRMLNRYFYVIKEDGSAGNIHVSTQWYDRELLKNYDGQVTVGLDRCSEQLISMDGQKRRRLPFMKVDVWVLDNPGIATAGKPMRDKIRKEVSRIIRERRTIPFKTDHSFYGIGPPMETHKAYHAASASEIAPNDGAWTELTASEYEKLWYSDDDRFSKSTSDNGKHPLILLRFKLVDTKEDVLKKLTLKYEGYGTAPGGNGVTFKIWNDENTAWESPETGTGGTDETLTIELTENLGEYVNSDGYLYVLAKTTNASDGNPTVLYCDYPEFIFEVNGLTYVDVSTYRDTDIVEPKPFIFHTEFIIKGWLFETVLGG